MARRSFKVTLGSSLGNGKWNTIASSLTPIVSTTAATDAMATLQADAASPTETHVDEADTAVQAVIASVAAVVAPNLFIEFDDAVITTKSKLRFALRKALDEVGASSLPD